MKTKNLSWTIASIILFMETETLARSGNWQEIRNQHQKCLDEAISRQREQLAQLQTEFRSIKSPDQSGSHEDRQRERDRWRNEQNAIDEKRKAISAETKRRIQSCRDQAK
jgi:hypothetical protein